MMFLVHLNAAAILLVVLQFHSGEADCTLCEWTSWGRWTSCDHYTCGGLRHRRVVLCCRASESRELCMRRCGRSRITDIKFSFCTLNCVFGHKSDGRCVCNADSHGKCCQYKPTTTTTATYRYSNSNNDNNNNKNNSGGLSVVAGVGIFLAVICFVCSICCCVCERSSQTTTREADVSNATRREPTVFVIDPAEQIAKQLEEARLH